MSNNLLSKPIYFEYTKAANPKLPPINAEVMNSGDFTEETIIMPIDLSESLQTSYKATTSTCLVSFINLLTNESLNLANNAISNLFVIISGTGTLKTDFGDINWQTGDIIAIPFSKVLNIATTNNARIYWVNDEPLVNYLGVIPKEAIFSPTHYPYLTTKQAAEDFNKESESEIRNRNGVILGNEKCLLTKTVTPTLWALYNVITPKSMQAPHQHNSVALDLCFSATKGVYTLMSKNIDANGTLINPIRMDWKPGAAFITPPAWWHSHHNESDEEAVVIPIQDAGLHTYLRTLFIKFAEINDSEQVS